MNYIGVIPVAVEAIAVQQRQLNSLSASNAELSATVAALLKRIEKLEAGKHN